MRANLFLRSSCLLCTALCIFMLPTLPWPLMLPPPSAFTPTGPGHLPEVPDMFCHHGFFSIVGPRIHVLDGQRWLCRFGTAVSLQLSSVLEGLKELFNGLLLKLMSGVTISTATALRQTHTVTAAWARSNCCCAGISKLATSCAPGRHLSCLQIM